MGSNLVLFLLMQFDLSFPVIPCSILGLDAIDISGEQHLDIVCAARINTSPLDPFFFSLHVILPFYHVTWLVCHHIHYCSLIFLMFGFVILFQKHNIIKKRIDHHGKVIEARPDGIGAPKVSRLYLDGFC